MYKKMEYSILVGTVREWRKQWNSNQTRQHLIRVELAVKSSFTTIAVFTFILDTTVKGVGKGRWKWEGEENGGRILSRRPLMQRSLNDHISTYDALVETWVISANLKRASNVDSTAMGIRFFCWLQLYRTIDFIS